MGSLHLRLLCAGRGHKKCMRLYGGGRPNHITREEVKGQSEFWAATTGHSPHYERQLRAEAEGLDGPEIDNHAIDLDSLEQHFGTFINLFAISLDMDCLREALAFLACAMDLYDPLTGQVYSAAVCQAFVKGYVADVVPSHPMRDRFMDSFESHHLDHILQVSRALHCGWASLHVNHLTARIGKPLILERGKRPTDLWLAVPLHDFGYVKYDPVIHGDICCLARYAILTA